MGNLLFGWAFLAAFYFVFMRGYSSPDPARTAKFEYRRSAADRFDLLPPSREPFGIALWCLTALGFVAAIAFFLVGDRYVMVASFLFTLWRDDRWIKRQPGYQEALAKAKAAQTDT